MIDRVCATTSCMSRAMRARSANAAISRSSWSRAAIASLRSRIMRMVARRARCQNATMTVEMIHTSKVGVSTSIGMRHHVGDFRYGCSCVDGTESVFRAITPFGFESFQLLHVCTLPPVSSGPLVMVHAASAAARRPMVNARIMKAFVFLGLP